MTITAHALTLDKFGDAVTATSVSMTTESSMKFLCVAIVVSDTFEDPDTITVSCAHAGELDLLGGPVHFLFEFGERTVYLFGKKDAAGGANDSITVVSSTDGNIDVLAMPFYLDTDAGGIDFENFEVGEYGFHEAPNCGSIVVPDATPRMIVAVGASQGGATPAITFDNSFTTLLKNEDNSSTFPAYEGYIGAVGVRAVDSAGSYSTVYDDDGATYCATLIASFVEAETDASSVTITGIRLISKAGSSWNNEGGITAVIYKSTPSSAVAPDKVVTGLSTNSSGVLDDIDISDIQATNDAIWLTLMKAGTPSKGTTVRITPTVT